MSIQHTINEIMTRSRGLPRQAPLTAANYKVWKRGYIFEGLKGIPFGRSFCNYFGVSDNILLYERDAARAESYINKNYVR